MTEEDRQKIRVVLMDTLQITDDRVVGKVSVSDQPPPGGIWVELNGIPCYLGSTIEAARLTATIGDCWMLARDGDLNENDIRWFDRRGTLGPSWTHEESFVQEEQRRIRVQFNLEWVESWIKPESSDSEEYDYSTPERESTPVREFERRNADPTVPQFLILEFVHVEGWKGLWILDDDIEFFQRVHTFRVLEDRYVVQLGEKREAKAGLVLSKKWELDRQEDNTLLELRMFDGDEKNPVMVSRKDGNGKMIIERLDGA